MLLLLIKFSLIRDLTSLALPDGMVNADVPFICSNKSTTCRIKGRISKCSVGLWNIQPLNKGMHSSLWMCLGKTFQGRGWERVSRSDKTHLLPLFSLLLLFKKAALFPPSFHDRRLFLSTRWHHVRMYAGPNKTLLLSVLRKVGDIWLSAVLPPFSWKNTLGRTSCRWESCPRSLNYLSISKRKKRAKWDVRSK